MAGRAGPRLVRLAGACRSGGSALDHRRDVFRRRQSRRHSAGRAGWRRGARSACPVALPADHVPQQARVLRAREEEALAELAAQGREAVSACSSASMPSATVWMCMAWPSSMMPRAIADSTPSLGHVVHERLVDLDDVDREAAQVAQRRVARAEVVEGDADAQIADLRRGPSPPRPGSAIRTVSVTSRTSQLGPDARTRRRPRRPRRR